MLGYREITSLIGFLVILYLLYNLSCWIQFNLQPSKLYRYKHLPREVAPDGEVATPYALITGASDGIGFCLAEELCGHGFNVVLHGRNPTKLEKVKAGLERNFKVDVKILVLDAGKGPYDRAWDDEILQVLGGLNLTVVINNVGGNGGVTPDWAALIDRSAEDIDRLNNANAMFMGQLARVVLPLLIRNQPALMLNISSGAELFPLPHCSTYAACKSYVSSLTRCLRAEMKIAGHDIEMMSFVVGKVATAGTGRDPIKDVSLLVPNAKTMARSILAKVGCGSSAVVPYWPHQLQVGMASLLSESMKEKMGMDMSIAEIEQQAKRR